MTPVKEARKIMEHNQARHKINKILMRDGISLEELLTRPVLGRGMRVQVRRMIKESRQ